MNASELLANSLSADAAIRQDATAKLESAARENYPGYVLHLSAELVNEQSPSHVRTAAGVALKNALTARDYTRLSEYAQRWLALSPDVKSKIKQDNLNNLNSPAIKIAVNSGQVIASIAAIELPEAQWPELIPTMLASVSQVGNVNLRIATLQTIGFICEQVKPEILAAQSNDILTAVVQGARQDEPNKDVTLAAMHALYNSLEFVRENFEREGERNYLMQVVCEATQHSSTDVQVAAFECLVRIMGLYYDKMGFYMERALFGLTVIGMKNPNDAVALQAIEFWSTVCEEEIELAIEAVEAAETYGEPPERESKFFAKTALPEILPVILDLLLRQEEDADEDEWNISMAAGTCLSLLSRAVQDVIVQPVIPFIENNIKGADWHQREAAVMAFGSILDGPDPSALAPLVDQALPILIDMMQDPHIAVKDTTAWTLGCICELMSSQLNNEVHLRPLIQALVAGVEDTPRISANCSWSLMNLVDQMHGFLDDEPAKPTGPLSPYYEPIVATLLRATEKPTNEANYRTAAYEALASYVTHAPADCIKAVETIILTILARQEHLLSMQNELLGADDRSNWNELQTNFCSIIISVIRKLGGDIKPLTERIMTDALNLIRAAGKHSTTLEDAILLVGTMASAIEQDIHPYVNAFLPFLVTGLQSHEETQLCTVSIGVIGDICRALGEGSLTYTEGLMNALYQSLQSPAINRTVKISVLSCFGDIAIATGGGFEPYVESTMGVLKQAGDVIPDPNDYDMLDYVQSLREGIIEAYVGIVTALRTSGKGVLLLPYIGSILELIHRTLIDEEKPEHVVKLAIGLIGDLGDTFKNGEIRDYLLADWIINALKARHKGYSTDTKRTIKWAKEVGTSFLMEPELVLTYCYADGQTSNFGAFINLLVHSFHLYLGSLSPIFYHEVPHPSFLPVSPFFSALFSHHRNDYLCIAEL
ncbi:karyopherin beta [Tulasnella sp. 418]|nr:karyopherin beta [Tulasnella sp. 418]